MIAGLMPDADNRALERLSATMQRSRALEDRLRGSALDVNAMMMLARMKADGGATAGSLASELGLSQSKVSRLTACLIDAGLVDEHLMPDDLRKNHLKVTRRGDNLLVELSQVFGADALSRVCEERSTLLHVKAALGVAGEMRPSITELVILIALRLSSDRLSVGDLSALLAMDQPKVSMALRGLRRKGLVTAASLKGDRRIHLFSLTAAGESVWQTVESRMSVDTAERTAPIAEAVQNETDESSAFAHASESGQSNN